MTTIQDSIAALEAVTTQAHHIAAHAKAVSRSFHKIDPMVSAMFRNVADDADDLIDRTEDVIDNLKAQRQMRLDEVFRTLVLIADDDAPTWDDQWEVDQARFGEDLRFRVESEVL